MSIRFERANSQIQKNIGYIIQNRLNDPRIDPMLYVSEASVSPDFKTCKVKISFDYNSESQANEIIKVLQNSEGFIKHELANMVKMPQVPKLIFILDKGTKATQRINEILSTLNIPKEEDEE